MKQSNLRRRRQRLFIERLSDYGIQTSRTGSFKMRCPKCNHKSVSLSVNTVDGVFNCHGPECGFRGSLKRDAAHARPSQWLKKDYFTPEFERKKLTGAALEFFKEREIDEAALARLRISVDNGSLVFPYTKEGEVCFLKYRSRTKDGSKKIWTSKSPYKIFYGYDDISEEQTIICEGELDKLSFDMADLPASISVPFGAPNIKQTTFTDLDESLEHTAEKLDKVERIILAVDNDECGKKLEEELARRLGKERCLRVIWPEGCKDANDVLATYGKEFLRECVENAQPFPIDGVFSINHFTDRLMTLYDEGLTRGFSTGWFVLDHLFTVLPGELTIVTGIPGHGKSSFIEHLMINLIKEHELKAGIFTPEHNPVETHVARLAELYIGKPFASQYANHERISRLGLQQTAEKLNKSISYIIPDEMKRSVDDILNIMRAMVCTKGIHFFVLDNWNEFCHAGSGESETHYIRASLAKIRRFARAHNVHIFLIAHPAKMQKDKQTGHYLVPKAYDISGSAHWFGMADNVMSVYRYAGMQSEEKHDVQVHVQKIKRKNCGQLGVASFLYEYETGRFKDAS
jgi:twinkle protein